MWEKWFLQILIFACDSFSDFYWWILSFLYWLIILVDMKKSKHSLLLLWLKCYDCLFFMRKSYCTILLHCGRSWINYIHHSFVFQWLPLASLLVSLFIFATLSLFISVLLTLRPKANCFLHALLQYIQILYLHSQHWHMIDAHTACYPFKTKIYKLTDVSFVVFDGGHFAHESCHDLSFGSVFNVAYVIIT